LAQYDKQAIDERAVKKYLMIDLLHKQIEKNINMFINSEPNDGQDAGIISLLKEYKEKSTSGLPEARNVIKSHIRNVH
jgi:hypothetical protein